MQEVSPDRQECKENKYLSIFAFPGLDSPLIFSSMALDLSSHHTSTLLQSILRSPSVFLSSDVEFANPHDLAAVVKWTLARVGRVDSVVIPSHETSRKGTVMVEEILIQQRGFLEWESYTRWARQEKKDDYLVTAFSSFIGSLSSSSRALLVAIFSLLSSTTSYSHKNGMTPSRLSRLFGVLLFGLPEDETFEKTYEAFVKAGNATEHLLLAYIRDTGALESLPTRLADHIQGYPAMLSADITKSSGSVKGVPVTHVNKTVRLYSLDLISTACEMDVGEQCSEWKACCSSSDSIGKDPQLSDRFRKLINLRGGKKQGRSQSTPKEDNEIQPYGSLVDKQWGDFMYEGFSAPDQSKLTFDLRESERKARSQRPGSVQWSQFEKSGFVIADDGLASVLSFDDGLRDDLERWPAERAELMEKLRKANKMIPSFAYDTTPYIVSSPTLDSSTTGQWDTKPISQFDEVFAEVYADILLGNGWSNRDEQTHRNANFVMVQYKSRPTPSTLGSQSAGSLRQTRGYISDSDDRIDAAWFVVEEIVPAQYRSEMEASGRSKGRSGPSMRKLNIFRKKKEDLTPKNNNNHQSNHQSDAPSSSFDELFRPGLGGVTKKLHLNKDLTLGSYLVGNESGSTIRQIPVPCDPEESKAAGTSGGGGGSRLFTTLRSKSMRMRNRPAKDDEDLNPPMLPPKKMMTSNPFTSDDFDTRSLHDPELEAYSQEQKSKHNLLKNRHGKKQSNDDSWLDVMTRANGFRMAGQDSSLKRNVDLNEEKATSLTPTPSHPDVTTNGDGNTATSSASPISPAHRSSVEDESQNLTPSPVLPGSFTQPEEGDSIPRDGLQAAGWTMKAPSVNPPQTPPKTERRKDGDSPTVPSKSVSPSTQPSTSPAIMSKLKSSEGENVSEDLTPRLMYLRPLPPKTDLDEREKAREIRIQAAKDRAKQLRASLNPLAVQELESRKEKEASKPLPSLLPTPLKSPVDSTDTPSPRSPKSSSARPGMKDDPFSKDRFSGRVANVASRFGGGAAKPVSPQSTGNSVRAASPTLGSPGFATGGGVTKQQSKHASSHSPMLDPNEPPSRQSVEYSTVDNDSISPDDAASNFSRDSNPDEDSVAARGALHINSLRAGGSIAASSSYPPGGFPSDLQRREEEDVPKAISPGFRVPYQPGMPLSNLEEESESVLSGSNL